MLCGYLFFGTEKLKWYGFANNPVGVYRLLLNRHSLPGNRRERLQTLAGDIAIRSGQPGNGYLVGLLLLLARGYVLEPHEQGNIVFEVFGGYAARLFSISRFFAALRVQCSIALAAVNRLGEKLSPKNEMNIEKAR